MQSATSTESVALTRSVPISHWTRAYLVGFLLPLPGALGLGGSYSVALFIKLAWLAGVLSIRELRLPPVLWLLLVWVSCSWLWSVSTDIDGRFASTIGLARWAFDFSFFFIGAGLLRNESRLDDFTRGARAGIFVACVYVAFVIISLGYAHPQRLQELAWGDAKIAIRERVKDWPNYYGVYLAILICLFRLRDAPLSRLAREPVTVFCFIVALCSVSRAVMLLFVLFVFSQILMRSARPLLLIRNLACGALFFFLLLQTPLLRQRVVQQTFSTELARTPGSVFDKDVLGRLERWRDAVPFIRASPVFGYGQRSLHHLSPDTFSEYWGVLLVTGSVHNDFVDMALRTGIPGVLIFCWFVFAVSKLGRQAERRMNSNGGITLGLFGTISVAMLVVGMTGDFYRYEAWSSLFWLLAGAVYAITAKNAGPGQSTRLEHR